MKQKIRVELSGEFFNRLVLTIHGLSSVNFSRINLRNNYLGSDYNEVSSIFPESPSLPFLFSFHNIIPKHKLALLSLCTLAIFL